MKILCVIDSLEAGGAQRQMVELAKGFKERSHEVTFLVYHVNNFYTQDLIKIGIEVNEIIEPNYLYRLIKIRKFIRKGNYDSVISFLEASNFMATIAGFPFKKWSLIVGERSSNPNILKSFKLGFYRWFHIFADYVVTNSFANKKMVHSLNPVLSDDKCKVIYNIVDQSVWAPNDDFEFKKEKKLNLVVAASHQYLKNCIGLVEAVNKLSLHEKSLLRINWYGGERSDNSLSEAKMKIKQYQLEDCFCFHGETKNIEEKLKYADAVGLFSFYEGLPNAVCEGMHCGKPIISSNVSDVPLLMSNKNLLCNPIDIQSITKTLSYLIDLSPDKLRAEAVVNRQKALELFDKDTILDSYMKLMKKNKK